MDKAKDIIKDIMSESGCSMRDLNQLLANNGVHMTEQSLANKLSRGTFSADFFVLIKSLIREKENVS